MLDLLRSIDIAELTGVRKTTVSSWKRRYDDFPTPVYEVGLTTLYDRGQVMIWLKTRGKI